MRDLSEQEPERSVSTSSKALSPQNVSFVPCFLSEEEQEEEGREFGFTHASSGMCDLTM
jgi:hypothetical protein